MQDVFKNYWKSRVRQGLFEKKVSVIHESFIGPLFVTEIHFSHWSHSGWLASTLSEVYQKGGWKIKRNFAQRRERSITGVIPPFMIDAYIEKLKEDIENNAY